jgi:acylphosphatase
MKHIVVRGRVQGVGFRAFVEHHALLRGVEGWVRNRSDGTVEAVFAGTAATVEDIIAACKAGPRSSKVDTVEQRPATAEELTLSRQAEIFSCLPTV